MKNRIKIYCKNTDSYQEFEAGVSLLEIYQSMGVQLPCMLTCAKVNNKTKRLTYQCYRPKDVEFVGIDNPSGMRTYVRSLCFVLSKAAHDLFPDGKLFIEHSLSKGYYCIWEIGREVNETDISALKVRMNEIIAADFPFEYKLDQTQTVVDLFRKNKMEDKALLLETTNDVYSKYNCLDGYINDFYGVLLPSTKSIYLFDIAKYNGGLLLRVPNPEQADKLQPYVKQEKMLAAFHRNLHYQRCMNLTNVGDLNLAIEQKRISNVVTVAEARQEREIAQIADEIKQKFDEGVRIILISGPSSSGKTTFCKRLQVQLMTNMLYPFSISLDDYYVNRVETPLTEEGEYDYESLYAIDLPLFNADLKKILDGEKVNLPTYDFVKGERVFLGNSVQLGERSVLVMEGIHAMNPELIPHIPQSAVYKIYVSALTSISLDDHNWISTTDNRLIRRMVRDYQFRNYSAIETISRWPLVREGEDKWIFPFQENADAMVNSAMLYELAALRRIAESILQDVPKNVPEYSDAHRLLKFLRYFNYINVEELPNTSLLREFVGGSIFG